MAGGVPRGSGWPRRLAIFGPRHRVPGTSRRESFHHSQARGLVIGASTRHAISTATTSAPSICCSPVAPGRGWRTDPISWPSSSATWTRASTRCWVGCRCIAPGPAGLPRRGPLSTKRVERSAEADGQAAAAELETSVSSDPGLFRVILTPPVTCALRPGRAVRHAGARRGPAAAPPNTSARSSSSATARCGSGTCPPGSPTSTKVTLKASSRPPPLYRSATPTATRSTRHWTTSSKAPNACATKSSASWACSSASGVVEAGCQSIVGQRLKLDGILTLRCHRQSNRWDDIWPKANNQIQPTASGTLGLVTAVSAAGLPKHQDHDGLPTNLTRIPLAGSLAAGQDMRTLEMAVREGMLTPRRHRHPHPALPPRQQPLGRDLAATQQPDHSR